MTRINPSAGNISSGTQSLPIYTSFLQPASISEGTNILAYTYGSDENRIKSALTQNSAVTNTRYYLGDYEKDITGSTTKHIHYISAGDGFMAIVIRENGTDTYYYTYTDHLGSLLHVTNSAGTVINNLNYDAWGRYRSSSTWAYTSVTAPPAWLTRGYTGHEHLPLFGIINMNGRLYDPVVGRMLAVDNNVQDGASTQGYNRYSYALNNPLKYTDPDGEFAHLIFGALIGGAINWATHGFQFNAKGLGYFGVGAFAGALGAGIGAGISSSLAGGSFGAGFWGTSAAKVATSSFLSGAAIGGGAGAAGGFVNGSGNSLLDGNNFGSALWAGGKGALVGGLTGGIIGGVSGGLDAAFNKRNFWHGGEHAKIFKSPISENLGNMNGECALRCFEEFSKSYGLYEYNFDLWYKLNGSRLGVNPSEVESIIESSNIFNSDKIIHDKISKLTDALSSNKRIMMGFNTDSGGAHAVMVSKIKIWPNGNFRMWFAETSPVRIAPFSIKSFWDLKGPGFWSLYKK